MRTLNHPITRAETERWLTPRPILDALGAFDLDPCGAPGWPTAAEVYTPEEHGDGLSLPWRGRVWLNPPYGVQTGVWLRRLVEHGTGTALIFARTETAMFFESVWRSADALLFIQGRVKFLTPDGEETGDAGAPSVLVAYGPADAQALRESAIAGWFVDLKTPALEGYPEGNKDA